MLSIKYCIGRPGQSQLFPNKISIFSAFLPPGQNPQDTQRAKPYKLYACSTKRGPPAAPWGRQAPPAPAGGPVRPDGLHPEAGAANSWPLGRRAEGAHTGSRSLGRGGLSASPLPPSRPAPRRPARSPRAAAPSLPGQPAQTSPLAFRGDPSTLPRAIGTRPPLTCRRDGAFRQGVT